MPKKRKPGRDAVAAVDSKAAQMVKRLKDRYRLGQRANRTKLSIAEFSAKEGLSTHTVRKLRRLAREYTPAEFEELCALRRPGGLPLHVGHLPYLLVVTDKQERKKLHERAAREGWSAPRLAAEIPEKYRTAKGHGRPTNRPATAAEGLRQLIDDADRLRRRCEVVGELVRVESKQKKLSGRAAETRKASAALRRELRSLEKSLSGLLEDD